jgi:cbb3-type cytochrome oxidase maturation protein
MSVLVYLIPAALLFGLASLIAFLWALKSGQYEDLTARANGFSSKPSRMLPHPGMESQSRTKLKPVAGSSASPVFTRP